MITHKMRLSPEPFGKIANGTKKIESRIFDEKRKAIRVGDRIEFSNSENNEDKITVRVRGLYVYDSFENLFDDFPPEYFGDASKKSLIDEISRFYTKKEQSENGVIGIRIESEK